MILPSEERSYRQWRLHTYEGFKHRSIFFLVTHIDQKGVQKETFSERLQLAQLKFAILIYGAATSSRFGIGAWEIPLSLTLIRSFKCDLNVTS